MSYTTLQKDLERITLKKDLDLALEKMVDFEEEINRNEESESEDEEDFEEEEVEEGNDLGFSIARICMYINGRSERCEDNQR